MNKLNKKILIVEDEKILTKTMEERLSLEGFDVVKAYDGLEGLEKAMSENPDLIILDILLPNMNGIEMLKKLRTIP